GEVSSRVPHAPESSARGAPARGPLPGDHRELSTLTFRLTGSTSSSPTASPHRSMSVSTNTKSFRLPFKAPFWAQILAGLVLGVLLGWLARSQDVSWLVTTLEKVGGTFIGLLKLAVAPLVFFAILVSITNLRKVNNAARLASRTLLWFMITSLIAVAIGFLTGLVPTDVITPFTELNVLQIVFMAAVAGIAALQLGEKAEPILTLSESVLTLLQKALWWVIRLAPIGTAGLIGNAIATYGW